MTFRRVAFIVVGALGGVTGALGYLVVAALVGRWLAEGHYDLIFVFFFLPLSIFGGWMGHEHWRERVLAGKEDAE